MLAVLATIVVFENVMASPIVAEFGLYS